MAWAEMIFDVPRHGAGKKTDLVNKRDRLDALIRLIY